MHACMYACMHVCMHVCMYACMHVYMYACSRHLIKGAMHTEVDVYIGRLGRKAERERERERSREKEGERGRYTDKWKDSKTARSEDGGREREREREGNKDTHIDSMQSNMKSDIHTRSWRDICFSRASSRMRCWKSFSTSLPGGLRIQVFMYVCTFVRMPVCISVCFSVREIYASRQTLCLPFCSVKYGLTQRRAPARTDVDMRNAHAQIAARSRRRAVGLRDWKQTRASLPQGPAWRRAWPGSLPSQGTPAGALGEPRETTRSGLAREGWLHRKPRGSVRTESHMHEERSRAVTHIISSAGHLSALGAVCALCCCSLCCCCLGCETSRERAQQGLL